MEESTRTYTSTTDDYNLTCSTKNQISSPPKKKHNMVLNLGTKPSSTIFSADQTPTPTRFIRNCEEVGLFQDLHVNPFDETFRKAVESGKTGSLALQSSRLSVVTDDTLHTPHVFPHIIENDAITRPEPAQKLQQDKIGCEESEVDEKVGVVRPAVRVVRQEADTSQLRPIAPLLLKTNPVSERASQPVQLILQMPDGRLMQLNATPLDTDKKTELQGPVDLVARIDKSKMETGSVILHTSPEKKQESDNISPLIKEKLKARLSNTNVNSQLDKTSGGGDQKVGKIGQKEDGSRSKRLSSTSNASNSEDDEETKRRKFLERNRAAAMRCREKRKFWVATLERRAEQMMSTNQQLQLEVGALRAEVAHLKTLLLAHKDCPVTQAMCNNQLVTGPVVFPVDVEPLMIKPEVHVTPIHIVKPLSADETAFRQNLRKKLRFVSIKKKITQNEKEEDFNPTDEIPKKKRLSLDIETAKQSQCLSEKNSPLIRSDEYLSSTLLPNESLELESLRDVSRPVATQVIQVNPNVLYRENSLRLSSPNIEGPLLPISPHPTCIDYS